eukprot:gnl/Dysnectes_brevis/3767_a4841_494.p1 GENE.gnl/Dysnectes_brevis/3767_a4841_494~~gnl/Dysnectes_brevis/3767_a4841_494.p1  ORF type:complete len:165 (+),score=65.35 gnl/Dysnectes_brevis/3767_a4841_494:111-605(+)
MPYPGNGDLAPISDLTLTIKITKRRSQVIPLEIEHQGHQTLTALPTLETVVIPFSLRGKHTTRHGVPPIAAFRRRDMRLEVRGRVRGRKRYLGHVHIELSRLVGDSWMELGYDEQRGQSRVVRRSLSRDCECGADVTGLEIGLEMSYQVLAREPYNQRKKELGL